ncbi:hypothetical protein OHA61_28690 [Streptomyces sp. NBC_00885]|nr:hypothetical protein OHA61_28690 [Streptomyces sp. NBC_00885]
MIAQLVRADRDTVRDVIHNKKHARIRSEKGIRWGGGTLLAAA